MRFTKMHGLGNDYIYFNCLAQSPDNLPGLARRMSRRRYDVGADGIICICPSLVADCRMEMYNADGSQGEMCGNGIRCVGKYLYDHGLTQKTTLQVETLAGIRTLWLHLGSDNLVGEVTVHMGQAEVAPCSKLQVGDSLVEGSSVWVGNPHYVMLWEDLEGAPVETLGRAIEHHPTFPNRTNVEFLQVRTPTQLAMRVWERGSGETHACGTGAAAAFATARSLGLCDSGVEMHLLGGVLKLSQDGAGIQLRGGATTVYEGVC